MYSTGKEVAVETMLSGTSQMCVDKPGKSLMVAMAISCDHTHCEQVCTEWCQSLVTSLIKMCIPLIRKCCVGVYKC